MKIKLKVTKEELDKTLREDNFVLSMFSMLSEPLEITVYGVILLENEVIFVICLQRNPRLINLLSGKYFEIVDAKVSSFWKFYQELSNENIIYFERIFDNFNFIGIDRLFSEPDFFRKYHQDDAEALKHICNMVEILEAEANSEELDWLDYV